MAGPNLGPKLDFAQTMGNILQRLGALETRDVLQNASIGANGLVVSGGGSIIIKGGGSLIIQGTGTISVPGTLSSAGAIVATTSVTAGTSLNSTGDTNVGGTLNVPNSTLVSAYARSHSVVTSYVAAYIDGSGNFLSTPSSLRMKRDIADAHWTPEQWRGIRTVFYRLRAAWILADMRGEDPATVERLAGVIGEELLALGLDEFVVLDEQGRVFTVRYELLGLVAIDAAQQLASQIDDLRGEVAALAARVEGQSQTGGLPEAE